MGNERNKRFIENLAKRSGLPEEEIARIAYDEGLDNAQLFNAVMKGHGVPKSHGTNPSAQRSIRKGESRFYGQTDDD